MSKIVSILLIIFLQLLLPTPQVLATVSCEDDRDTRITLDKDFIPETTEPKVLEFTISNTSMARGLQGKQIVFQESRWLGLQNIKSEPSMPISNTKFSVELQENILKESREHNGVLHIVGEKDPLCGGISYEIGTAKCSLDQAYLDRNPIRPNGQITIKFKGLENRQYNLIRVNSKSTFTVGKTTTDSNGTGSFDKATIDGIHGETIKLYISTKIGTPHQSCNGSIRLLSSAGEPEPPEFSTVTTEDQPVKVCTLEEAKAGKCTFGGGIACGTDQINDPGIETAIGCIHTQPSSFARDILKFAIGISGGLAFLMMLLGAFQMLTSAGSPDSLKAGQDRLTSAVVGLLFVIFATLFLQIIGVDILKLPGFGR